MPSPFPGMDPYLEHRDYFPGLHGDMITYLKEFIQPLLPPHYLAKTNERVWMELSDRVVEPDVDVLVATELRASPSQTNGGGVATISEVTTRPIVITLRSDDEEFRQNFLEIYAGEGSQRRLVTSIEILSKSNKSWQSEGHRLYRKKQQEMLAAKVHLVEIDLLRSGEHTTAVPFRLLYRKAGPFDYHVCIHRFNLPHEFLAYPISLSQQLPIVEIPLLPGDRSVSVDLQAVFNRCYETGAYEREINYHSARPSPSLSPEQEAWARKLIAEKRGSSPPAEGEKTQ
jgi:hypothetical protein